MMSAGLGMTTFEWQEPDIQRSEWITLIQSISVKKEINNSHRTLLFASFIFYRYIIPL